MKLKSSKLVRIAVIFFLLFSFLYLIIDTDGEEVAYQTNTPFITDIVVKTIASGVIVPKDEVEIKSKVSGIVDQIFVMPGNVIMKDDLILQIKIIPNMVELSHAEARWNQAKIDYESTHELFEKQNRLFLSDVIPEADFLKYKTEDAKSKQEYVAAEDHLELIRKGIRKNERAISNTMIRSSISGTVQNVRVKKGGVVIESNSFNEGTTIASIANMNEMVFEGYVSETEIGQMKAGDVLSLHIPAIKNDTLMATLDYISPKGEEVNGTIKFKLLASLQKPGKYFIRSGFSANAEVILEKKSNVLAIEESWIQFDNDQPYVEVETDPSVFVRKNIVLGISDGINTEVIAGLAVKDKVKTQ